MLLDGSGALFQAAKSMLDEYGVNQKLARMQREAETFREKAEAYLLGEHPDGIVDEDRYLFYTAEESEEFE
jgi:excinuclease UvrABC nuclease subunit